MAHNGKYYVRTPSTWTLFGGDEPLLHRRQDVMLHAKYGDGAALQLMGDSSFRPVIRGEPSKKELGAATGSSVQADLQAAAHTPDGSQARSEQDRAELPR